MGSFDHISGSSLRLGDAELYYEQRGEGPVLLLLHGGVGTLTHFNPILDGLKGFRVVGMDSRGHGRSTMGTEPLTYQRLEEDVRALLSHLGIEELSLLGFSDGGTVACRLAARPRGLNIRKLVPVGATWKNEHSLELQEILSGVTGKSWRSRFPEDAATYELWNPRPNFDAFVEAVVEMWMDQTDSGHPGRNVERIDAHTLVVRGDDDHLVPLEWCSELKETIEDSHFLNIPFAGHVAFADQPQVFLSAVAPFLRAD